jgi:hypothetical protein
MRNLNKTVWSFHLGNVEAVDLGVHRHGYSSSDYGRKRLIFPNNINCHLSSSGDNPITETHNEMMSRRLSVMENEDERSGNSGSDAGHIVWGGCGQKI